MTEINTDSPHADSPHAGPNTGRDHSRPAAFVAELYRLDRGKQAELRRTVSDGEGARWLTGLLYRTGYERNGAQAARLVAGLFALKPSARDEDDLPDAIALAERAAAGVSLATQLAELHLAQNSGMGKLPTDRSSTEQRFLGLLDADRQGLSYHLRQAVQLVQGGDMQPDWVRLLNDVTFWGEPVRRRWADDFYRQVYRSGRSDDALGSDSKADADTASDAVTE